MGLFHSLIYQAGRMAGKAAYAAKTQLQESAAQSQTAAVPAPQPTLSPWEQRLRQAQQPGTPPSEKFDIGMAYLNGEGTERDKGQAARWFQLATESGYSPAEAALAHMFLDNTYPCSQEEGMRLLKKCADYNIASLQIGLAMLYENQGDDRNFIRYLEMAKQNDEGGAWYNLGLQYAVGGVLKQNPERAHSCFLKAAEKNISDAQFFLYKQYSNAVGVEKDMDKAVFWLHKAVENDNEQGLMELAWLYKSAGDIENAKKMYSKAACHGNQEAAEQLKALGERNTDG